MCHVLLIGKYPPLQGGIATKTWSLVRALEARGIFFDIITVTPPSGYATPCPPHAKTSELTLVPQVDDSIPWTLPGGDMIFERLTTAALHVATTKCFDWVETNYLAPYGLAAAWVAEKLHIPLILRHAGSDITKILNNPLTGLALAEVFNSADIIVTHAQSKLIERFPAILPSRFRELPRYRPDPNIFYPSPQRTNNDGAHFTLLCVGKFNYYWELRALDLAARAVKTRPNWRLLSIGNGKSFQKIRPILDSFGLDERITHHDFVSPYEMGEQIRSADAVWSFLRSGGVEDVSNVLWEAAACAKPTLVNMDMYLPRECNSLNLNMVKIADTLTSVGAALDEITDASNDRRSKALHKLATKLIVEYEKYIDDQAKIYQC